MHSCKRFVESVELMEEDTLDRTKWNDDIQYHSGDLIWCEMREKKKNIKDSDNDNQN